MRIIKKYDERRDEILDAAERLFYSKGFERCTVNDILKEVDIAKGTFYHYFKSKEEAMDAIISRNIEIVVIRAEEIIKRDDFNPVEKLMNAFLAMRIDDKFGNNMLDDLHKPENALLHQKNLNQMIGSMAPILVKVIEEGIEKNVWSCRYPLQYMQVFLAASLTLTDKGIFEADDDSQMIIMAALISMLEKMLEVSENSFMELYLQNWD
ncbi:MAG: TetR/AcrR family transcriptional regulator [Proteocatella sp.]